MTGEAARTVFLLWNGLIWMDLSPAPELFWANFAGDGLQKCLVPMGQHIVLYQHNSLSLIQLRWPFDVTEPKSSRQQDTTKYYFVMFHVSLGNNCSK